MIIFGVLRASLSLGDILQNMENHHKFGEYFHLRMSIAQMYLHSTTRNLEMMYIHLHIRASLEMEVEMAKRRCIYSTYGT
jgi:hypothetical protein